MTEKRIEPVPTPDEAAAIMAALEALRGEKVGPAPSSRSRWRLAGVLGRPVPPHLKLEGSPWSYRNWEGVV